MLATFFNSSNNWFGYISNFFFAAAGILTVIKLSFKWLTRHNDAKIDQLENELKRSGSDMDAKFELILAQYRPNGGSSNKDQMNRIEKTIAELKEGQDILHQRIDNIKQDFAEHKGYHKGLLDGEE
jgi:chromosome segregation ATPase